MFEHIVAQEIFPKVLWEISLEDDVRVRLLQKFAFSLLKTDYLRQTIFIYSSIFTKHILYARPSTKEITISRVHDLKRIAT